jgi:hypothetical protein
MFNEFVKK